MEKDGKAGLQSTASSKESDHSISVGQVTDADDDLLRHIGYQQVSLSARH